MPEETSNNHNTPDRRLSGTGSNLQIRYRLALGFSLLLLVVASVCWLVFQNELNRSMKEYSDVLGATLAEQTAASVRELVLVNDLLGLNVVLSQLVRDENISYAAVYDVDNNLLASAGQNPARDENTGYIFTSQIQVQEATAGSVALKLDISAVQSSRSRLRNSFLLVVAAALVLTVAASFALAGGITTPVNALTAEIASRTDSEPSRDENGPRDETALLQQSVANLLDRFQEMENRLEETGLWQDSGKETGEDPARLAASILVVKAVNINTAIELLHPSTLGNLLKEYVFYLNQAARIYGGKFHRLTGESVMLCFDEDNCGDRHSVNALYCAGLFRHVIDRVNDMHREKGRQTLEYRMAIHSGDVFVLPEVFKDRNGDVTSGGVLGQTIDITYFLSKNCTPGELVISESAFSQAGMFEDIGAARQQEFTMPADNMMFMAYIVAGNFFENMKSVQEQSRKILDSAQDRT